VVAIGQRPAERREYPFTKFRWTGAYLASLLFQVGFDVSYTYAGRYNRRQRIELGMAWEQLASAGGETLRQSEVSRLENDRVGVPRRERLERIAEVLQVPPGELLARSGWAEADTAEAFTSPQILNAAAVAPPTIMELLDEIKGLVEEIQTLLLELPEEGRARQTMTFEGTPSGHRMD